MGAYSYAARVMWCLRCTAYVSNIIENPRDPKFRRINLTNKAFVTRVASCGEHGMNFLTLCGFQQGGRAEYIPEGKDPAGFIVCQSTEEGGDFDGAMRTVQLNHCRLAHSHAQLLPPPRWRACGGGLRWPLASRTACFRCTQQDLDLRWVWAECMCHTLRACRRVDAHTESRAVGADKKYREPILALTVWVEREGERAGRGGRQRDAEVGCASASESGTQIASIWRHQSTHASTTSAAWHKPSQHPPVLFECREQPRAGDLS